MRRAWIDWIETLEAAELFAFDTETTSLDYMQAEIVGLSFAVKAGEAAYVPLAHRYADAPAQLDREQVLKRLKPLLEERQAAKLGHHIKYDAHVLLNYGIKLAGMRYDSMLESYVLDSVASRHDMDSLAEKYLDYKTIHYEDVAGKGAKQIGFDQVRIEDATRYAAEDADVTLRLHQTLWPELRCHARAAARCSRRSRCRWCRCCSRWSTRACSSIPKCSRSQSAEITADTAPAASAGPRTGGRALQPGFAQAAAGNPVREDAAAGGAQDRRAASHPPRKTCWRNWRRITNCPR